MIDALIFDFDGTILDTEGPEYATWQAVYREYGQELDLGLWAQVVGSAADTVDLLGHLEDLVGHPLPREAIRARRAALDREMVERLDTREGVRALIGEARRAGVPLAVASSSSSAWVTGHLRRLGLLDAFRAICTSDETGRAKPDPASYLLALTRLGAEASRSLAIEDSPTGLLAAVRAGVPCLVVPNPVTARFVFPSGAHVVQSLAGVHLRDLEPLCVGEEHWKAGL